MLEKMADFFEKRIDGYDYHMLNEIEGAKEFYQFTASCLPTKKFPKILDLGCGTGLELEFYYRICPTAKVTGIDLSALMLSVLKNKFNDKDITLIQGNYFDIELCKNYYDAVVSVESLHHFTMDEKLPLYKNIFNSLSDKGYFILTDYFANTEEDEKKFRTELIRQKKEYNVCDNEFYHYDTPLTVNHECDILKLAGFGKIEILGNWSSTYTIKASK